MSKQIENMPLLSLVTSVYNSGPRLKQFLKCIFNQTYLNLQIIIVDDCSSDKETLSILDDLLNKKIFPDKSFIFIKNTKNIGLLKSFQKGLKKATGDYIIFPEADDYIDYDFCEVGIKYLLQYNADVVKGLMLYECLSDLKETDSDYEIHSAFGLNFDYTTSWHYIFNRKLLLKNSKTPSFLNAILYACCKEFYSEYLECEVPVYENSYYICYRENKKHISLNKEWNFFIKQIKKNLLKYIPKCV